MIEDLSMHVADVVTNALRAGAKTITVRLERRRGALTLEVTDDGRGMNPSELDGARDPFYTTKERAVKVGLGLPLLAQTAETLGGSLEITSKPGGGTTVRAVFPWDHPDRPPLGDLCGTLLPLVAASPGVEFSLVLADDDKTWQLDTSEVRRHIGDLPLTHREVISFLQGYVRDGMRRLGLKEEE
ncbi:MAG: ATP-binding protein [Candidatus Bipolaricaulaceae bacterium]